MGPRYHVVMGSTPDPVPDLISLSQAGSRFDFEPPPKASEMQPSLSSHALKQLLKLSRVLERLFFVTRPPHPLLYWLHLTRISSLYPGGSSRRVSLYANSA